MELTQVSEGTYTLNETQEGDISIYLSLGILYSILYIYIYTERD